MLKAQKDDVCNGNQQHENVHERVHHDRWEAIAQLHPRFAAFPYTQAVQEFWIPGFSIVNIMFFDGFFLQKGENKISGY